MGAYHRLSRLEDLPSSIPAATFVVVDVIICSTAIVHLLDAGASYVKPFRDTETARKFKRETEYALIVGEEDDGERSDNFDFPPVPALAYDNDVAGRPVGIRTSNGTRAIDRIGTENELYIGSTINAAAVGNRLREQDGDVWIVAAGRNGSPVDEDLAAVEQIYQHLTDGETSWDRRQLLETLAGSPSTPWLRANADRGVETILDFDSTATVPRLEDGVFV
jgi:2-phosphosulfolactate phosphatase